MTMLKFEYSKYEKEDFLLLATFLLFKCNTNNYLFYPFFITKLISYLKKTWVKLHFFSFQDFALPNH